MPEKCQRETKMKLESPSSSEKELLKAYQEIRLHNISSAISRIDGLIDSKVKSSVDKALGKAVIHKGVYNPDWFAEKKVTEPCE